MKNLNSFLALFYVLFLVSCAKEESPFEAADVAPLYQHWALAYDNDIVNGMPYSEKYPDATELTEGYAFFSNGKGVDYGYTPKASFTYEITKDGADKIIVITKSIPTIHIATNHGNYNFEGGCSNNLSNGSGCNNTENFNDVQEQSVVYEMKIESFKIIHLTRSSLQGFMMN